MVIKTEVGEQIVPRLTQVEVSTLLSRRNSPSFNPLEDLAFFSDLVIASIKPLKHNRMAIVIQAKSAIVQADAYAHEAEVDKTPVVDIYIDYWPSEL